VSRMTLYRLMEKHGIGYSEGQVIRHELDTASQKSRRAARHSDPAPGT